MSVCKRMDKQNGKVHISEGGLRLDLIIYVSYAQVRHHQLELLYEVYTSCILCEEANSKAKHHPAPIGNLVLRSPAKDSASSIQSSQNLLRLWFCPLPCRPGHVTASTKMRAQ